MPSRNAFPLSQGELIRCARGEVSQTQFAKTLGVDRSCLSRYESEKLGAPTAVLNHCLRAVAAQMEDEGAPFEGPLQQALRSARKVVAELEASLSDKAAPRR
jgi:predicted transcriptional regulator